jgi:cysteinyl-tRNA synthetase
MGVLPPTYEPRATGHMMGMIDLIQRLIDRKHAYIVRGQDDLNSVYFSVPSRPDYGELTHEKQNAVNDSDSTITDEMGPSVDDGAASTGEAGKRDPRGLSLWKETGSVAR